MASLNKPVNKILLKIAPGDSFLFSKRTKLTYIFEVQLLPLLLLGNATLELRHSGEDACGIPDGDSIILTGGREEDGYHNYVTRWEDRE